MLNLNIHINSLKLPMLMIGFNLFEEAIKISDIIESYLARDTDVVCPCRNSNFYLFL